MPTSTSINAAVAELSEGITAARQAIAEHLRDGTRSDRQLRHLVAALAGLAADLDEIRTDLDALDVEDLLLIDDGRDTIVLWRWERNLRHELGTLGAGIRLAQEVADRLVAGVDHRTHVVRSGETLQTIAAQHLGSWREWPRIAQLNDLEPGQPASGTVLTIPPRR